MGKTKSKPKKSGKSKTPAEVMTLSEAAAFLRVAEEPLRADALAGRLPAQLVGGEWRFGRTAVLGWLESPHLQTRPPIQIRDETPEEQEAFLASLRAHRDEVDRATKSGRYAEE